MQPVARPFRLVHWVLIVLLVAGTVGVPQSAQAVSATPANITIKGSPTSLVADGSTLAIVSGTVTDALYNPVSGVAVAVSPSDATVMIVQNTSVTTDVNGTYTTVLQATSKAGSANICATVPGTTISTCMTVQSTVPAPAISLNPTSVWAGGAVTVSGTNTHFAAGNTVVDVIAGSGTVAQTLSGTVTSPTSLSFKTSAGLSTGTYTVRVTTGSEVVSASLSVTQSVPASISLASAAAKVSTQYTGAVGLSGSVVDAQGRPVPGVGVNLTADTVLVSLASPSALTGADGSYTSSFTVASPAGGTTQICASVQGTTISACTTVQTIVAGPAAHVTIIPASSVPTGGSVALSGVATDAIGNPVAGGIFTLSASLGSITPASVTAAADGSYTATFTAPTTAGLVTITATSTNGTLGTASVLVTTPGTTISLSPTSVTAGGAVAVSGTGTNFVGGSTMVEVISDSGTVVQTSYATVTNPTSLSFTTAPGLVSGTYVVRVTTGAEVALASLSVTQMSGPVLVRLESSWTVDAGYTGTVGLSGTVTNQEVNPVPGVTVDLTTDNTSRIRLGATSVTTGTDGSFSTSFTVTNQPPGSANICAKVRGTTVQMCRSVTVVVAGPLAQATIQGAVPIVPPGTNVYISGVATDSAGNPVSGAQFTLSAAGGSITPATVTAAPDGSYTATLTTSSSPGIATVQALSGSLTLGTAAMVVAPHTGAMIGPGLGSVVAGQAVSINGTYTHFVQGTTAVDVITNTGTIVQTATATVASPTTLSFTPAGGLPTGSYLVRATTGSEIVAGWLSVTQAHGATAITLVSAATTISMQYKGTVGLTGTVKDAQGNAVPGVAVDLSTDNASLIILGTTFVTTGSDGSYAGSFILALSLQTSSGQICAHVHGTSISSCTTINTIMVGVPYKVTITPAATSVVAGGSVTLSGVLTDPNGTPIAGGSFGLTTSAGSISPTTVTAAADGSYTATFTAPNTAGLVTITATGAGGALGTAGINVTLMAPGISLNPTSVVAGNVVAVTGSGTHFVAGSTVVDLIAAGGTVVETLDPTVTSATNLSFTTAPGLLTGSYTVRATTGTEVAAASLSVTQTSGPAIVGIGVDAATVSTGYAGAVGLGGQVLNGRLSPMPGVAVDLKASTPVVRLGTTSVTTGLDGTYASSFTVTGTAGSADICATVHGTSLTKCTTVTTVMTGALYQVTIAGSWSPVTPPGTNVGIWGVAMDSAGHPVSGAQFTLSATGGSITPTSVTAGADGRYTATFAASGSPGIATIRAQAGSLPLGTAPLIVAVPAGAIDLSPSSLGAGDAVNVSGTNTHFVDGSTVVDVIAQDGTVVQTLNASVASATKLSFKTAPGLSLGTYLVRVTTSSEVQAAGLNITPVHVGTSITLVPAANAIFQLYAGPVGLTGVVQDPQGSPVSGVAVGLSTDNPSLITLRATSVTTRADGSYTSSFNLVPSTATSSGKICAGVQGTTITACTTIHTIIVGVPYKVTITPSATSVVAGGSVTLNGVLTDPNGTPIAGGGFGLSASAGSINPATVSAAADGSYTATFTAPTTAGAVTIRAANSNVTLGTASITVTAPPPVVSAGQSTVTNGTAGWVVVDGASTATITVVLRDAGNTPVPGRSVALQSSRSTSTVTPVRAVTDASGVATFAVKDTVPETVIYTAVDTTDNLTVTQTASVTYYIPQPVRYPPTPTATPPSQGDVQGGSSPSVTTNPDGSQSISLVSNADKAQTDLTTNASLKIGVGGGAAQLQMDPGTIGPAAQSGPQGSTPSGAPVHVNVQLSLLAVANLPGVSASTGTTDGGLQAAAQPLAPNWKPQVAVDIRAVPQSGGVGASPIHQLAKPVTISFILPPVTLAVAQTVVVAYYNPDLGIWVQLPTKVDPTTGTVSTTVSHFTTFAVLTSGAATSTLTQMAGGAVTTPIVGISGTSKGGSTIVVYDNGVQVQTLKPTGDVAWSIPVQLQPGVNALAVVSSETGGKVGLGESTVTYTPPVTAPVPPSGAGTGAAVGSTSSGAAVAAVSLWDLGGYDWARPAIVDLVAKGIMSGYTGVFHPEYVVTRAEFVDTLVKALHLTGSAPLAFRDADEIPELLRDGVATAVANGLLKGLPDGTLRPRAVLSRAEAAVLLSRALQLAPVASAAFHVEYADHDELPVWALDGIGQASAAGLMRGYADGGFHPDDNLTRAQVAVLIERYLQKRK